MALIFNICEGIFWLGGGLLVAARSRSAAPPLRRLGLATALTFAAFAGTDFIEAKTGAWYRPTWLLIYNGVCVTILVACWIRYRVVTKRARGKYEQ